MNEVSQNKKSETELSLENKSEPWSFSETAIMVAMFLIGAIITVLQYI